MSKLETLIQQLCPDGVNIVELGSFAKAENTRNKKGQCNKAFSITQRGLIPTSEYFKEAKVTSEDTSNYKIVKHNWFVYSPSRIDVGSINYLRTEDEVIVSPLNVVFSVDETVVLPQYLLEFLNSRSGTWQILNKREGIEGTGRKLLPFDRFASIRVPFPPLEVQREIVHILDNFTELTAELTTELTARKKQYEYYREHLLTFGDNIAFVEIGSVIKSLNTGLNPRRFFKLNTDDATNYYITIREIRNNTIVPSEKTDRINDEALRLCNNRSNLEIGDVLFSGTGTIGETAVIEKEPRNWNIKEGVYTIKPNQDKLCPRFLMYLLQTQKIRTAIMKKVAGGTVKSIPMGELKKISIPLPALDEQRRIVSILDRFDALCNDLTSGLPAEIAARQKQYEYYRDKLLGFEELQK